MLELQMFSEEDLIILEKENEFFAAGFFSGKDKTISSRIVSGLENLLSKAPLPAYNGELLYPCGASTFYPRTSFYFHYIRILTDESKADENLSKASCNEKHVWEKLIDVIRAYPAPIGYTHCCVNYERFLDEGLPGFSTRIKSSKRKHSLNSKKISMLNNEKKTLDIFKDHLKRIIAYFESLSFDGAKEDNRITLIRTFKKLLVGGISGFDEGMRGLNLLLYWDGVDSLGRFDSFMYPYYKQSQPGHSHAISLIKNLWENIDQGGGLNVTLGGSDRYGNSAYSELTKICIEASYGMRRPNLALRCRSDMPNDIWETSFDCLSTGTGNPAFYGEKTFLQGLQEARLNIGHEDYEEFCFGGCTETMLQGKSNVGSIDHDLNQLAVLEKTIYNNLQSCATFEDFLNSYKKELRAEIRRIVEEVNAAQKTKSLYHIQPIRSLFVDDCIENGVDFTAGGARYNWSVVNFMGISNTVDSLYNIRHFIFEKNKFSKDKLIQLLKSNYEGAEDIRQSFLGTPKFGNSDSEVDKLAFELSSYMYEEMLLYAPYRGGRFLPSCIMFVTYANFGKEVGATPDGRLAQSPLSDSIGATQGMDKSGPTAAMYSALQVDQIHAIGTLVLNLRLSKNIINSYSSRMKLRQLTEAYLLNGGQQVQYNILDQQALKDAYNRPGTSPNLIVRMGGFSEYFDNLDEALKLAVIERSEHNI